MGVFEKDSLVNKGYIVFFRKCQLKLQARFSKHDASEKSVFYSI